MKGRKTNTMTPFTTQAMVHSLKATGTVTILEHKDNNNVIAEYNGQRFTAIYNIFTGLYYVDDIYGKLD